MHKVIYIAGKYSNNGKDNGSRQKNIAIAKGYAIQLWNMGFGVICPHTNTALFDDSPELKISWEEFISLDCEILSRCDAVYLLPNWKDSEGAKKERKYAKEHGITIIESLEEAKKFISDNHAICNICGFVRTNCREYHPNKKICVKCASKFDNLKELYWAAFTSSYIPIPR